MCIVQSLTSEQKLARGAPLRISIASMDIHLEPPTLSPILKNDIKPRSYLVRETLTKERTWRN